MASAWSVGGSSGAQVAAMKTRRRVEEVHIDGASPRPKAPRITGSLKALEVGALLRAIADSFCLAMLKLVKHCRDSLPQMVTGSLLGLDSGRILEITHCFPFPAPRAAGDEPAPGEGDGDGFMTDTLEGGDYQMEMMKMLREVNVDNNLVGWYKSIYAGSYCSPSVVESQFSYQENLSDNCVVLLYDPIATATKGALSIRAYQLSEAFMQSARSKDNKFVPPSQILVELPLKIRNPGLVSAFLYDVAASGALASDDFDGLSALAASSGPLERYLEHMSQWVDDLVEEHSKFQYHFRNVKDQARIAAKKQADGVDPNAEDQQQPHWKSNPQAPTRLNSLLISNQINEYCTNIQKHSTTALSKLYLHSAMQSA